MSAPAKPEGVLTAEELIDFKRKYIATADRSYMNDRLNVKLPDHLYGEWHGRDSFSQFHARTRGFINGTEYLTEDNVMHNTPEGGALGDVVFMVISKQKYEAMKEIDAITARKKSGIGRDRDEEYDALAQSLGLGLDSERSSARTLTGSELNTTIKR